LLLAAWFGFFTGLVEACWWLGQKLLGSKMTALSPHVIWMAPLAEIGWFLLPGAFLALAAWRWPKRVTLPVAVFLLACLGFFSLRFLFPSIHWAAWLLASVGLAGQATRLLQARPAVCADFLLSRRRFLCGSGVAIGELAAGVHGWQWLRERQALAKLPPAPAGAPNVLLITLDTVRAANLSLYGYGRPTTPKLERLSQGGLVFERALATAPWTLASHASIFTGRFPHELSVNWKIPLDAAYPTLAEVLSAYGYRTAGFVANLEYCSLESGLARGFAHYEDYRVSLGELVHHSSCGKALCASPRLRKHLGYYELPNRKPAAELNAEFLGWLSGNAGRPFFAFLNYFDVHAPYLPPPAFAARFGGGRARRHPFLLPGRDWSPAEVQAEIDAYDGTIASLDHHVGGLFDELRQRGLLENTLVLITSDHGEEFGEHGLFEHGDSLYLPALHVPLLLLFPGRVPAGRRVGAPVSLRDLSATVLDLVGLKPWLPGNSLGRRWRKSDGVGGPEAEVILSEVSFAPNKPDWVPVSKGDMKSLFAGRYHYIRNGDGREELYDVTDDPLEQQDLAGTAQGRGDLEPLRKALQSLLTRS
jgi:arylsulfatase A-like enzyme